MVPFVLSVGLLATVGFVLKIVLRVLNRGCRYRCRCVADSVALGALAAIATSPPVRQGDR
ncbi:hypothetical protein [Aquihabitans sp. McL0605]|uniref:hypothetical protein n=1 Tax=Aquihabitans sp. McL0605 TaxID=3415671 RepID=UPI003CF3AD41